MEIDATTVSLLLGALVTIIGVVFGIKGIIIKNHTKKFAADCAIVFDLYAAQEGAPTPAQLEAYYTALKQVIADAFALGNEFGPLFEPAQAATIQKINVAHVNMAKVAANDRRL